MTRISEESIDLAVLELFRRSGAGRCGARLRHAELAHRWPSTGLRHADLEQAIRRLEWRLCLKVDHTPVTGPDIELTVRGYRLSSPLLLSGREWMRAVRAYVDLAIAISRVSTRPDGTAWVRRDGRAPCRRASDEHRQGR